jgi:hypothetical protein
VYLNEGKIMGMNMVQIISKIFFLISDPINNIPIIDPLEQLAMAKQAIIKQKIEIIEIISGCETPNRYYVYTKDPQTGNKNVLFKCKEESDFCMRCCCRYDHLFLLSFHVYSSEMRSFKMKVKQIQNENDKKDEKKLFAMLDRPFTCTCCCLAR